MPFARFQPLINDILDQTKFAVVGASRDQQKFGYKVYQTLRRAGYNTYAVNPNADEIEGDPVYPLLDNVPVQLHCVVTVVQPEVTFEIVRQAGALRIPYFWMQPGSESESAIIEAQAQSLQLVYGGPCIMVEIAAREAKTRV